ncbi:MAG: thioredoxin family protein [Bacteroidetes bacterium]|nr:thioredoxin family protein [Bacteroidota bacterium]
MKKIKSILPWTARIILSFLFLLSALAKLYPSPKLGMTLLEIKQLIPMGFDACFAPYFSRFIMGVEISLGIALLLPHFLKTIVIPISTLLLTIFVGHLTFEIIQTGNQGNCGCFGALLPMTPLQAILKNLVAIVMLVYLYFNVQNREKGKNNFFILTTLFLGSTLFMFGLTPMEKCQKSKINTLQNTAIEVDSSTISTVNETSENGSESINKKDTVSKKTENLGPKKVTSPFSQVIPGIDNGKKLLCFFAPGCDHCQDAAKSIAQLSKTTPNFPQVYVVFMDEETEKIPEFFKIAGKTFPSQILDPAQFYNTMGNSKDTPGVILMWNGNIIKFFDGIKTNQFDAAKLKVELTKMK